MLLISIRPASSIMSADYLFRRSFGSFTTVELVEEIEGFAAALA